MATVPNTNPLPRSLQNRRLRSTRSSRVSQWFVVALLVGCGVISIATTAGIIGILAYESFGFFSHTNVDLGQFLTGTDWTVGIDRDPDNYQYGILELISGTLRITVIAMLIAIPIGLLTAVYLSEYAPARVRSFLKPSLEILAGIPTVVFGYFAALFITPRLLQHLGDFQPYNALAAGIAVGVLCIPLVSSLAEDALRSVPTRLREAAYGLGGTRFDVTVKVVLPAALSGIISAFLLAISRAVGETMIVAMAAGNTPTFTVDPRQESQTMTGFIVQTFNSENLVPNTIEYYSIYAVAIVLFLMTFSLTLFGQIIRKRFQEKYD